MRNFCDFLHLVKNSLGVALFYCYKPVKYQGHGSKNLDIEDFQKKLVNLILNPHGEILYDLKKSLSKWHFRAQSF